MFKIATTETYDPTLCIDEWVHRDKEFDFLLYITKVLNPKVIRILTDEKSPWAWMNKPGVLHLTVTGWGCEEMEPNVPIPLVEFNMLKKLFAAGYPKERVVLRIDPIIPTERGISAFFFMVNMGIVKDITRYRSSIMQLYQHSAARLKETEEWDEINSIYKGKFFPDIEELKRIDFFNRIKKTIDGAREDIRNDYGVTKELHFESCATKLLSNCGFENIGCMSERDLLINDLEPDKLNIPRGSQRSRCMCLMKHQLIPGGYKRGRCPHKCAYCYLKDVEHTVSVSKGDALF